MKKKFFALMMAMVMVLSLAACGGSDAKEETPSNNDSTATEAPAEGTLSSWAAPAP